MESSEEGLRFFFVKDFSFPLTGKRARSCPEEKNIFERERTTQDSHVQRRGQREIITTRCCRGGPTVQIMRWLSFLWGEKDFLEWRDGNEISKWGAISSDEKPSKNNRSIYDMYRRIFGVFLCEHKTYDGMHSHSFIFSLRFIKTVICL